MSDLKYGITLPYGDARKAANLARKAEAAGWDGVFVGDAIWCQDPLIQLAAAAMVTSRIRLGTMVLAMPLRRPWHLASESLALDHLSEGRLILGLGMGATWMGWRSFPSEVMDTRARAEMLDEAIDILTRLHQREQFDYDGKHYQLKLSLMETMHYPPATLQQPRVPIWIPAVWPRMKSMRRVLKCDGLLPQKMDAEGKFCEVTPADVAEMKAFIAANRPLDTPFEIVVEGKTSTLSQAAKEDKLAQWRGAGITWWIESMWEVAEKDVESVIEQGPPK
jgi:hypothetical protein